MSTRFQSTNRTIYWLLIIDILTIVLILAIILIPSSVLRVIIGLPFLLLFPGYLLLMAIFPLNHGDFPDNGQELDDISNAILKETKKSFIDMPKRLILSFGLSLAITCLIGMILTYTPWGINLLSVLISTAALIFLISIVVFIRYFKSIDRSDHNVYQQLKQSKRDGNVLNRILTFIIVGAILGTVGILTYAVTTTKVGEKYSEFYILGNDGKAQDYPSVILMKNGAVVSVQYSNSGTASPELYARVTLGIINHEQQDAVYSVTLTINDKPAEILYDGTTLKRLQKIALSENAKWEHEVGFLPIRIGDRQRVEFAFYKNDEPELQGAVHFWINVKGQ